MDDSKTAIATNSKMITDSSIKEQKEDRFGHHTFVRWLLSRVEQTKEPLNIGIFGKWGVGKTGILQMFESEIIAKNIKNIHYVQIDCWKLTPQSLREQLLISIDKKFGGKKEKEIKNRLYDITTISVHVPNQEKLTERLSRLVRLSEPYLIMAGITITAGAILDWLVPNEIIQGRYLLPLVGSTFIIPLVLDLSSKLAENSASLASTVKQMIPPIQSPIEFEKLFDEILKQKKEDEKLVIALDNLDRCEGNLVIDTISMVKSFMEHKNVIFIVPCDDDAIVKHLESIRKFQHEDAREFLRKFFQATVEIPPLLVGSIIDYTDELVKEYGIPINEEVKYVLSIASMDNPRRIKQFLNNFAANLDLAKEREKTLLKENTITSKPEFLAKILVLRDQFPEFYKKLLDDENLLYYIEKHFQNIPAPDANMGIITELLKNKKLENFLQLTRQIEVDDILPFIKFGQESREKTLGEYTIIQENTRFCNFESISKLLDNTENRQLVVETIIETVKNDIKQRRFDFGFNGLKILLFIITKLTDGEKTRVIDIFSALSSKKEILEKIHYFDKKQIFDIVTEIPDRYRKTILEYYCESLGKLATFDEELLELLFKNKEFLTDVAQKKFGQSFTQLYTSQELKTKSIIEKYFVGKPERINLLDITTLDHIIGQITVDNVKPENRGRIDFYLKIKSRANEELKNIFLDKILSMLIKNPQPTVEATARYVIDTLLVMELNDITPSGSEKIISALTGRTNTAQEHAQKFEFLKPMIRFMSLLPKQSFENFVTTLLNGIMGWPMPYLNQVLDEITKSEVKILEFSNIKDQLINRMKSENGAIASFLLTQSNNNQKESIVNAICSIITKGADPQLSAMLTSITSNITHISPHEDTLSSNIITRMKSSTPEERKKLFSPLILLHPRCSEAIKKEIDEKTLELIQQKEPFTTFTINSLENIWKNIEDKRKTLILEKFIEIVKKWIPLDQNSSKIIEFIIKNKINLSSEYFEQFLEFLLEQNKIESSDVSRKFALEAILKIQNLEKFTKKIQDNIKNANTVGKPELEKLSAQIISKLT